MADLRMKLSNNFSLGELVKSETAERQEDLKREQESPPDKIISNLKSLAETALQPIRERLGFPIRISSGYRSPGVNSKVGGSSTSQHCHEEAADCSLSPRFLESPETESMRKEITDRVQEITGKPLKMGLNPNGFLFAFICLHLDELDVDQVIHEYGQDYGQPSWVHISASTRQDKRQIMFIGKYTGKKYLKPSLEESLSHLT